MAEGATRAAEIGWVGSVVFPTCFNPFLEKSGCWVCVRTVKRRSTGTSYSAIRGTSQKVWLVALLRVRKPSRVLFVRAPCDLRLDPYGPTPHECRDVCEFSSCSLSCQVVEGGKPAQNKFGGGSWRRCARRGWCSRRRSGWRNIIILRNGWQRGHINRFDRNRSAG